MTNLLEELRLYRFDKKRESIDDHAADAMRYAFMSNAIYEFRKRRTPWVKIIILVLACIALAWIATR